ncbi:MAG: hypothetical protein ABSA97_07395 [Verrucomicrobiia bacterium]
MSIISTNYGLVPTNVFLVGTNNFGTNATLATVAYTNLTLHAPGTVQTNIAFPSGTNLWYNVKSYDGSGTVWAASSALGFTIPPGGTVTQRFGPFIETVNTNTGAIALNLPGAASSISINDTALGTGGGGTNTFAQVLAAGRDAGGSIGPTGLPYAVVSSGAVPLGQLSATDTAVRAYSGALLQTGTAANANALGAIPAANYPTNVYGTQVWIRNTNGLTAYSSLTNAVIAAVPGDTVLLGPKTFNWGGRVLLLTNDVSLIGIPGQTAITNFGSAGLYLTNGNFLYGIKMTDYGNPPVRVGPWTRIEDCEINGASDTMMVAGTPTGTTATNLLINNFFGSRYDGLNALATGSANVYWIIRGNHMVWPTNTAVTARFLHLIQGAGYEITDNVFIGTNYSTSASSVYAAIWCGGSFTAIVSRNTFRVYGLNAMAVQNDGNAATILVGRNDWGNSSISGTVIDVSMPGNTNFPVAALAFTNGDSFSTMPLTNAVSTGSGSVTVSGGMLTVNFGSSTWLGASLDGSVNNHILTATVAGVHFHYTNSITVPQTNTLVALTAPAALSICYIPSGSTNGLRFVFPSGVHYGTSTNSMVISNLSIWVDAVFAETNFLSFSHRESVQ